MASTGLCVGTGVGCTIAAVTGTVSLATAADGIQNLSSEYQYQNGQRVVNSFSSATAEDYNPIVDATLDIVPNLLAAGTVVKAAKSATNSLTLVDDAISDINAVKTALSSPNTLSTTGGDIISGAVGGYSTGGSEGAITGAFSGLFTSVLKLDPLMSGSISNLSGQALGLVTDEFKDNGMAELTGTGTLRTYCFQ